MPPKNSVVLFCLKLYWSHKFGNIYDEFHCVYLEHVLMFKMFTTANMSYSYYKCKCDDSYILILSWIWMHYATKVFTPLIVLCVIYANILSRNWPFCGYELLSIIQYACAVNARIEHFDSRQCESSRSIFLNQKEFRGLSKKHKKYELQENSIFVLVNPWRCQWLTIGSGGLLVKVSFHMWGEQPRAMSTLIQLNLKTHLFLSVLTLCEFFTSQIELVRGVPQSG